MIGLVDKVGGKTGKCLINNIDHRVILAFKLVFKVNI